MTEKLPTNLMKGLTLVRELGTGRCATVYLAQLGTHEVAVKVLAPHLLEESPTVRNWRLASAELAQLRHPNIVQVMQTGTWAGRPFQVCEYVPGESLAARLNRSGPLPEAELWEIARATLKGLSAALAVGVIHRDLKPNDLLLASDGTLKVVDFTLQNVLIDDALSTLGQVHGTPEFIAPEEARNEKNVDTRGDLYALGISLFNLATGAVPFASPNISLLLTRKCTDDVPDVRQWRSDLSPAFAQLIARLCRRDAGDRPATPKEARTLIDQLRECPADAAPAGVHAHLAEEASPDDFDVTDTVVQTVLKDTELTTSFHTLRPHQVLFYEDETSTDCYLLVKGKLEILRGGRRVALVEETGSFIGEVSALHQAARTATVRALEGSALIRVTEEAFRALLTRHPELHYRLSCELAHRLGATTRQLADAQAKLARLSYKVRDMLPDLE